MPDQFGGVEVDEPVAPPAAGPARDEFGGVSIDDEALRLATTVPKSITGTIERAITYGAPASQMGRRMNQRERAGGTFLPTESEEGDARQTGLFEPLVSIPRVAAEDPRFQAFLTGATGQPPTPETASGAAAAINVGAGLAEFPTSPLGPAALLAPGAGEIPAAATALGFAEQMSEGVPQAATEAGRLSVEGTPQERKEAYLGLGTQIALPATLTGEALIPRPRVIPPRAPPGLPPRGRRITRTGSIDINYPPQPGERVTPPPVPPAPKPVSTPLATPEAEAAEAARLAAELGQEEEAPVPPTPAAPAPAAQPKLSPNDLEPALLVDGKPVTGGEDHDAIFNNTLDKPGITEEETAAVFKAFGRDADHIFVDKTGKPYTREQAAEALGEKIPLQSSRLNELKAKSAPAPAPAPAAAAPPEALAPAYTGPDATIIAGKPLGDWFKVTDREDLPKGDARKAFAKRIGVANQPQKILDALKNSQARIREIVSPPLKPEEALPATTESEFDRITREQDELEAKRAASQGKGETFSVFQKAGLSKEQLAQVGELSLAESKELARFANAGDLNRENFAARLKEAKARAARSQKEAAIDVPAEVTPTAPEPTGLISEEAESLKRERLETPEVAPKSALPSTAQLSEAEIARRNEEQKWLQAQPEYQKANDALNALKQKIGNKLLAGAKTSAERKLADRLTKAEDRVAEVVDKLLKERPTQLELAKPAAPTAQAAYEPAYDETAGDIERMAKLQGMTIQEWKDQPLRIRSQQVADYRAASYDMQALDKAIAEKDTRAASELVSRDPTRDKILRSYFEQLTGFERPLDWEKSLAKIEEKVPEQPPAPPAPEGEAGVTGKTDVDVPDLAGQAIHLSKGVDLDAGERRAIGRAIEDARAGKPQDLIDWVKKLKELAVPKAKVVKGIKFGGTGERAHDLIDWIKGNFPGGIRITSKSDFARYMAEKTGAARQILFMDRGDYADTVMGAAEKSRMGHWESQDEFLEDVLRAAGGRTTSAERLSREEQMLEDEAKQVEEFQLTALRNRGRTEAERNAAGKGVPVNTLVVGDTFRIKGQQVVVADVDPYGDVMLDGGRKWGAQRLSDGQTIYPDNGEIIKAPEEGSQGPGAASIAEFRARENRRRILANITGFLFGDRAGEVTDALLRKMAGEAVPKTMALAAESGNKMVRFASATTAGPHMARAQAREVLGDRFNDKPFRRRLGAVLVEDRLRAIRRGFLEAARDATDPAEQARFQAQANDVNTLVGPGRVFETEADFRRELRDPDIAGAIERHKQGPQYEAQLYHTTADGVLAGPGVNTGAFINLSPIYKSSPQAIFTSSRKGDYTRPFKRRSIFSRRAAGTADVYELDYEPLVERMLRGNYEEYTKRELYDQLVRDNVAAVLPPGEPRPTFDGRPAEKFQIKRQTLVTTQGGQTRIIPQYENLWVHPDVAHELRQAEHIGSPISNVALARTAAVINKVQLALGTDAVWHIGNMFSTISGSQGGENFLVDLVRKVPLPNLVDTITRVTISARRILQNDPEVLNQIAELSQMGSIRADVPERGRVSRLINLLDKAGRVVRDDMYRNLTQRKNILGKPLIEPSEAGRREWNNQLGQYNPRLMGQLESFFKEAGLAPFIVAARNFNRMALRKVTLSPGVRAANLTSAIQMRAVEAFGVFATLIAVPTILNTITTGRPAGRPGVPIGAIDTGRDDANGKHIYIDPAQWIGLRRGMRITGINALLEGMIRGQPARQIKKQMAHDFIGAVAHPWAGPIVQMGSVLGTGYTTAFFKESKDPGDYWENFKAAMKQINPVLHGWFQRQGKGITGGVVGGLTTFAGAAGVKSRAPLSAVNQVHDLANGWASRSQDPRIRSEYESHARESFSSDYQELRSALIRKDLQGAKQAYRDLREKGKKPSVIAQTLQHPHPFTGSARAESQFKSSLTPKERDLYDQAQLERKQLYQAFRVMLNTP